ncbi:Indoleamine 2,3-dioxygenase 2 [Varanus komodoensis]|nr:Indoleamine 2,3-dioxygenase 2 [Varanus komodoensis]
MVRLMSDGICSVLSKCRILVWGCSHKNLEPIVCLPGGSSTRGFILVTFLVEKAAVPGIKAMVQAVNAIHQLDNGSMEEALHELANSLRDMTRALKKMHDYVDPSVFYGVTRTFFSGLPITAEAFLGSYGDPMIEGPPSCPARDGPAQLVQAQGRGFFGSLVRSLPSRHTALRHPRPFGLDPRPRTSLRTVSGGHGPAFLQGASP